jgi:hypothetical protein
MALNLKKRLVVGRQLTYEEVDGNWTDIENAIANRAPLTHTHAISAITGLQAALDSFIPLSQKAANSGVAPLDVNGKVPLVHLPDLAGAANDMIFPTESITSADVGKIATFKNGFAQLPTFVEEEAQVLRTTYDFTGIRDLDYLLPYLLVDLFDPEEDDSLTLTLYTTSNTKSDFTFVFKDSPSGNLEIESGAGLQDFIDHFESVRSALNIHPMYILSLVDTPAKVRIDAEFIDYTDDDLWENTAAIGSLSVDLFANNLSDRLLGNTDFLLWPSLVSWLRYTLPDGPEALTLSQSIEAFMRFGDEAPPAEGSNWRGPYYLNVDGPKEYYVNDSYIDLAERFADVFSQLEIEVFYQEDEVSPLGFDIQLPYYATGVEFDVPTEEQTRFEDAFGTPEIVNVGNPPYNDAPILGQITAVVGSNVYISSQPIRSYLLKGENSVGFEPEGDPPLPGFSIGRLLVLDHENAGYLRSGLDYGLGPWLPQVAQFGCLQAIEAAVPDEQARAILTNSTALISLLLTIG